MTYQERQQRIEEYQNSIREVRSYYTSLATLSDEIIDYMNDASKPFPTSPMPDEFYYLKQIVTFFAPLADWDEYDERLFDVITNPDYWKAPAPTGGFSFVTKTYFEVFFFGSYVREELLHNRTAATMNALREHWITQGLAERELIGLLIGYTSDEHWYEEDESLTPLANFIVAGVKADESLLSFYPDHVNNHLFRLLLTVDADFAEKNVAHFLKVYKDYDENDAFNIVVAEMLLERNKAKYLPLVEELFPKMTSISSIYGLRGFFSEKFPEIYAEKRDYFNLLFLEQVRTQMFKAGASFYANFDIWDPEKGGYQSSFELVMKESAKSGDERVFDCIVELFGLACTSEYKSQVLKVALAEYKEHF